MSLVALLMRVIVVGAVLLSTVARAEPVDTIEVDGYSLARQMVPATGPSSLVAESRVLYLNKGGVTLQPGDNDSRTNKSTLAKVPTSIPAWNVSDATWQATVSCVKELFAPFDVTVVQTDPGPTVQHIEAVFGGVPSMLGMQSTIAGVAPFKSDCTIIENAMVFAFTDHFPQDSRMACEVIAQEIAHAYGLDHERLPGDPMTYMRFDGNRSFQNQLAECGEDKARPCGISGSDCRGKQNSVELLFQRLGAKSTPGDVTAPTIAITSPVDGAVVAPGFEITVNATDNTRVTLASLSIDSVPSGSSSVAPWTIKTPVTIQKGKRTIKVEVTDGRNTRSAQIQVTVDGEADTGDDLGGGCSTGGAGGWLLALLSLMRAGSRRSARSR